MVVARRSVLLGRTAGCSQALPLACSLALLLPATCSKALGKCKDEGSCQAYINNLTDRLEGLRDEMRGRQLTLQALEDLRTGILSGKRIELPSAQRQHLEGNPLVSEISFDARHRPISTNLSRHFQWMRTLAPDSEVRFYTFMPLKRSSSPHKGGPSALLVVIDSQSQLSIFNLDGDTLLDKTDLGHGAGRAVTRLALSSSQDHHFVLTADDEGDMRIHNIKVVAKKEDKNSSQAEKALTKKRLIVTTNFTGSLSLPQGSSGEARMLTTVIPIERGTQTYFVTGDSLGGIAVFFRNGTMKGRVRVTEDPGGVKDILRGQGQTLLFYSSHSFGFFSPTLIDVQYPPCTGWSAPLFDIVLDPSSASSRVILSLSDGDVLIFATSRGKAKACDLTLKFPHVSALPFKLQIFRGHVMALPTPLESTANKADYLREIYFFNLAAMDAGFGVAPSRAVALQVSFKPKQPDDFVLHGTPASSGGDRSKSQIGIRFAGTRGVELYELSLKQPQTPAAATTGGSEGGWMEWLNWLPKVGVFGVAMVGVIMWNVNKVTTQRRHDRVNDFDDEILQEGLRERRERKGIDSDAGRGGLGVGGLRDPDMRGGPEDVLGDGDD